MCTIRRCLLAAVGSVLRGFGAEGADRPGALLVEKAPMLNGRGHMGGFGDFLWLQRRHEPFQCRRGSGVVAPVSSEEHATHKRVRRLKGVV
jgi:hypothetical protein